MGIMPCAKRFFIGLDVRVPTATSVDQMLNVSPIQNVRKQAHRNPAIPKLFRSLAKRITIVIHPYDVTPVGSVAILVPSQLLSCATRTRSVSPDGTVQFAFVNMVSLSMTMEN